MDTKPLLYGVIGFILGGLLVSVAATTFEKPVTNMDQMTSSLSRKSGDEYDKAFLSGMIEHHESAIDMARLSEENAKHDEIKQLSKEIITAQEAEIDQMRRWQREWGYSDGESDDKSHSH